MGEGGPVIHGREFLARSRKRIEECLKALQGSEGVDADALRAQALRLVRYLEMHLEKERETALPGLDVLTDRQILLRQRLYRTHLNLFESGPIALRGHLHELTKIVEDYLRTERDLLARVLSREEEGEMGSETPLLVVEGGAGRKVEYSYHDLESLPPSEKVEEAGRLAGIPGTGVRLSALLLPSVLNREADHATFYSSDGRFSVSLPLAEVLEKGVLIYKRERRPLSPAQGGPLRLVIIQGDDACANVKAVHRIALTSGKGRDTRKGGGHPPSNRG